MKITGPGGATPPTAPDGAETTKAGAPQGTAATSTQAGDAVALLAQQIQTGTVSPQQAVGQLVEMVMSDRGVAGLPESLRIELRAALDALADEDPYIAELVAAMQAK